MDKMHFRMQGNQGNGFNIKRKILLPFKLKTFKKIIDRHVMDIAMANRLLHQHQYVYRAYVTAFSWVKKKSRICLQEQAFKRWKV